MVTLNLNADALHSLTGDLINAQRLFENPRRCEKEWGVDGSTIRSFSGFDRPLNRYNKWARQSIEKGINHQEFDAIHNELRDSLKRCWNELSVARTYKLVDLFILRMAYCDQIDGTTRMLLQREGHPALDRFTFKGLAEMVPGLVIGSPSMGAIEGAKQYIALQYVIRQITDAAGVPNLAFDIWCWPEDRRRLFNLEPRAD